MRASRWLIPVITVVASVAVLLVLRSLDEPVTIEKPPRTVTETVVVDRTPEGIVVIVATEDIPAGADLDPYIDRGAFALIRVLPETVVEGAVTNIAQLEGRTTLSTVFANEQIVAARLSKPE